MLVVVVVTFSGPDGLTLTMGFIDRKRCRVLGLTSVLGFLSMQLAGCKRYSVLGLERLVQLPFLMYLDSCTRLFVGG